MAWKLSCKPFFKRHCEMVSIFVVQIKQAYNREQFYSFQKIYIYVLAGCGLGERKIL